MGNALRQLAAVSVCSLALTGCAGSRQSGTTDAQPGGPSLGGALNPATDPQGLGFANAAKEPTAWDGFVSAMTENPVARGMRSAGSKTAAALTPKPREYPAHDPISLSGSRSKPSAELYVSMARVQEEAGDLEAAAGLYETALKNNRRYVPAMLGLAHVRFRQERREDAFDLYTKAREVESNNLAAILGQAHYHDARGNLVEASKLYQEATRQHPSSANAWNDLGLCFARQRQLEESQLALQRAVELDQANVLYRNNIATVLVELNRTQEALAHLKAAHGDAAGHYNLGFLLHRRGDRQGAARQFAAAVQADPSFQPARLWLDKIQSELGGGAPQNAAAPNGNYSAGIMIGPDGREMPVSWQVEMEQPLAPPEIALADDDVEEAGNGVSNVDEDEELANQLAEQDIDQSPSDDERDGEQYAALDDEQSEQLDVEQVAGKDELASDEDAPLPLDLDMAESATQIASDESIAAEDEETYPDGMLPMQISQPLLITGYDVPVVAPAAEPATPGPRYPQLQRADELRLNLQSPPLPE